MSLLIMPSKVPVANCHAADRTRILFWWQFGLFRERLSSVAITIYPVTLYGLLVYVSRNDRKDGYHHEYPGTSVDVRMILSVENRVRGYHKR